MTFTAHLLSMLAAVALPPAPTDGIRDDARVLSEKGRAVLVKEMQAFTERTGLLMFLDTNTFLDGSTNTRLRAKQLLPAWSGARDGVVMCVDRSSQEPPGIQVADAVWKRPNDAEVLAALDEVLRGMNGRAVSEETVTSGLRALMERLTELHHRAADRSSVWKKSDLLLATYFLSSVFIGALLIWIISRRLRRSEGAAAVQHYFPEVVVGQRFGAPYGGGVIVELTYRREV